MADITKCTGIDCPNKEKCYRYTANDSPRQAYFVLTPMLVNEEDKFVFCEYFMGDFNG